MQFRKFKRSAIYAAIFTRLSVVALSLPVMACANLQPDMQVQSTVLKPGESVADLAARNKISVEHLWEINAFAFSDKVTFLAASTGQTIWLPATRAAVLPLQPATHQAQKEDKSAP